MGPRLLTFFFIEVNDFFSGRLVELSCLLPISQELRKPSYAEICQRTTKDPPTLQPQKEQKPNTVACGKEERKPTETIEKNREPPPAKSHPGQPKDQRRQSGRRSSPPAVGKRVNKEQNTPPKSPQWNQHLGGVWREVCFPQIKPMFPLRYLRMSCWLGACSDIRHVTMPVSYFSVKYFFPSWTNILFFLDISG